MSALEEPVCWEWAIGQLHKAKCHDKEACMCCEVTGQLPLSSSSEHRSELGRRETKSLQSV